MRDHVVLVVDVDDMKGTAGSTWYPPGLWRIFASVKNWKTDQRKNLRGRWPRNCRAFELVFDPNDPSPNALRIVSEVG